MQSPIIRKDFKVEINTNLNSINWDVVISLFYKIEWKHRKAEEISLAFKNSTTTIFIYK